MGELKLEWELEYRVPIQTDPWNENTTGSGRDQTTGRRGASGSDYSDPLTRSQSPGASLGREGTTLQWQYLSWWQSRTISRYVQPPPPSTGHVQGYGQQQWAMDLLEDSLGLILIGHWHWKQLVRSELASGRKAVFGINASGLELLPPLLPC